LRAHQHGARPELDPVAYQAFRDQRLTINRRLRSLGVTELHCANPTYDGGGDLYGRDVQFLDRSAAGRCRHAAISSATATP
jgi:hypothetical protein